jgi:hypothetical protein
MAYTFLNLTGTPSLDAPGSKLMRAHVTKSNFAQRRRRISEQVLADRSSERHVSHAQGGRGFVPLNTPKPESINHSSHFRARAYANPLLLTRPADPNISVRFCASCSRSPYDPILQIFPPRKLTASSAPRVPSSGFPCRRGKCQIVRRG